MLKKEDLYNTRIVTNGDKELNDEIVMLALRINYKVYNVDKYLQASQLIFSDDNWLSYSSSAHRLGDYKIITIEELRAMVNQPGEVDFIDKLKTWTLYNINLPTPDRDFTKVEVSEIYKLLVNLKADISHKLNDYFIKEIKSRQIVEQPKTYKIGQRFHNAGIDADYILVGLFYSYIVAINLVNGNYYADPVRVDDFYKITERELEKIFGGQLFKFKLIEND